MFKHRSRTVAMCLGGSAFLTGVIGGGCRVSTGRANPPITRVQAAGIDDGVTTAAGAAVFPPHKVPATGLGARYRLVDLGSADGPDDADETRVSLNNRGDVALTVGNKAFLWRAGRRTPLTPVPDMPDMTVAAINDWGQAVGGVGVTSDGAILVTDGDAVLWSGGQVTSLGALPDLSDAAAAAINGRGQVVGTSGSDSPREF